MGGYTNPNQIKRRRAMAQSMMSNQRRKAPMENILKALGAYQGGRFAAADEAANDELKRKEMARMLRDVSGNPGAKAMIDASNLDIFKGTELAGTGEGAYTHPEMQALDLQRKMQAQAVKGTQAHDLNKIGAQGRNQLENTTLAADLQAKSPYILSTQQRRYVPGQPGYTENPNKSSGTTINVGEKGANKFNEAVGQKLGENFVTRKVAAEDARQSLTSIGNARSMLDEGIRTGSFANFRNDFGRILHTMGYTHDEDPTSNTDAYGAEAASRVANIIKAFGSGTGLSDADRDYATKAAAGDISMTEPAIRRLLGIQERQAMWVIHNYNKDAQHVEGIAPYPITVDAPNETGIPQGWEEEWKYLSDEEKAKVRGS